ncbi:hypothetical protein OFP68_14115 [Brachyspira hyodysenteriae]|uniref:hypothetical protein n=1 Tax=Brachyspira hyodysenteriae TaxID=159 RepID=UPI0022CD9637|nr:hypothetical protein [Brachyspira hyodysenteriae]MCZ9880006.1 hypothetical protein [Brachyspira hyodysenteriae]
MASTGIVGVPLETEKMKKAINISNKYFNNSFDNISKAIQTRDWDLIKYILPY